MFRLIKSSFSKLKKALSKSRSALGDTLRDHLGKTLSKETLEKIEQTLFEADLGSTLTLAWLDEIKSLDRNHSPEQILSHLESLAIETLSAEPRVSSLLPSDDDPLVILMVGVNGSGKTTTVAKLAKTFQDSGKKVVLAAADTFRAAAIDQLGIWAGRLGIDIVKGQAKGDPSAVVHDAISKAKAKGYDVVIADTAGRLESKTDLMHELSKMSRVCQKLVPNAPHETFLTIDATTGQNALEQVKIFHEFTPLTGLILTKLDGSAKGGIVLSIYNELGIPIKFIGIGEGLEDFTPFDPKSYVEALLAR